MSISDRIFTKRTSLGLSKTALAKATGVSDVTVGKWESGINQPKGRYLIKLAMVLGVSVNWLLTGNDLSSTVGTAHIPPQILIRKAIDNLKTLLNTADDKQKAAFLATAEAVIHDAEKHNPAFSDISLAQDVEEEKASISDAKPVVNQRRFRIADTSIKLAHVSQLRELTSGFDGNVEFVSASVDIGRRGFGLWVRGDSMAPQFKEGDLIIIDPDEATRPGDYVVASNGSNELTFKKYRARGEYENGQPRFELVPLNEDYETLSTDQTPIIIIGVVVEHRIFFR